MFEIIHTSFKYLMRSKMRYLLTVVGIAIGTMSVIIVSSIGDAGKSSINTELSGMGMDSLVVSVQSGAVNNLTEDELEKIKQLDTVGNAMPLMSTITNGTLKGNNITCMTWGVNEDADNVIDLEVLHGRLINKGDIAEKKNVCVIDEAIALENYKRSNVVGKKFEINLGGQTTEFEIIGVVKNGVNTLQNMLGGFIPDFVYVPYSVMQTCLGKNTFDQITVKLEDDTQSAVAVSDVKNALNSSDDYSVDNLLSQKDKMNNILSIATAALSAVAGISLIVSGISIMTVMLISVNERTREIGIKKSVGASNAVIMTEFLFESLLLTMAGSILGILSGGLILTLFSTFSGTMFYMSLTNCIAVLLISLLIGCCFGIYPAFKAASMKPVEALRHNT